LDAPYVSPVYRISQDRLNRFAEASGGTSKIHTDPEYARQTPFGSTLVHGLLLFALMEKELQNLVQDWRERGVLETTFVKPVKCDEAFMIRFDPDENGGIAVAVVCGDQTAVVGRAYIRGDA
jgi:acyl dehydratase